MRRARPADAPTATILTLSARERRERAPTVSEVPAAPARIIVFPGMSLLHLQALAAATRASQTQTPASIVR
jgi:hypothetical protein